MHAPLSDPAFGVAARKIRFLGIDFDGVMTDNAVYVFEDGREAVRCTRLEGFGLERARATGIEIAIISTERNPVVSRRAEKLKLACFQNIPDKVAALETLRAERGLAWDEIGFIGNDLNDLGVLRLAGLPIIVADSHESLDGARAFKTRRPGGYGAVREACDAIAAAREGA
jgi:YrbI family 3-deoxy-D-manno-octulosonate 8-phosphate phosphatase